MRDVEGGGRGGGPLTAEGVGGGLGLEGAGGGEDGEVRRRGEGIRRWRRLSGLSSGMGWEWVFMEWEWAGGVRREETWVDSMWQGEE